MWRVDICDKAHEPLFSGWFSTSEDVGEFVENTLDLFLVEKAEFYAISDGDRRIEYRAKEAACCVAKTNVGSHTSRKNISGN